MYQALYRKYRPRCFRDVAGQEHVTETLRRQIVGDRLSHAYLFVGTRGTGKTTCAKILSRAVNCQHPVDGEPCNACPSCVGIEHGSILDVLELDAASNNGVDNVRALREEAIYTPASVKKRVYIIDEVHMLSNAAFNALLKILEEPPEHLIFILATTELHKVPATILSRCQRFSFKRLSSAAIAERLNLVAGYECLTLTPDAAEKLAALADGSMRDGLSLLDQCASDTAVDIRRVLDTIGLAGQQELLRLAEAVSDRDIAAALDILDSLYCDGRDMASLLNELSLLMRDILVFKLSKDSPLLAGGFGAKALSRLSKKLTPERLLSCLEIIKEASFSLSRGGSVKLIVEMCLIRICDERLADDASAMLARIAKLEAVGAWERKPEDAKPQKETASIAPMVEEGGQLAAVSSQIGVQDISRDTSLDSGQGNNPDNYLDSVPDNSQNFGQGNNQNSSQDSGQDNNQDTRKGSGQDNNQDTRKGSGQDNSQDTRNDSDQDINQYSGQDINISNVKDAVGAEPGIDESEPPANTLQIGHEKEQETGDFWDDILDILKSDPAVFALLSDKANIQSELQGSALIIRASSPFAVKTIESDMFSLPLKEAARKALGREVVIRVESGAGNSEISSREKLERLRAFDVFKFE